MDPQLAAWINRVGLFLDFLAFWFAAPEILGKERLEALEARFEVLLERVLRATAAFLYDYYWRHEGKKRISRDEYQRTIKLFGRASLDDPIFQVADLPNRAVLVFS